MKIELRDFRKISIYEDAEQPPLIYHMTARDNLEPIINSGKIKTGTDFVCWFFTDLKEIATYIDLTGAIRGRKYYDFDGEIHTAPPLIPEDTIVLKMKPQRNEPLTWYRENTAAGATNDESKKLLLLFDNCRIAHFDDFTFNTNYEILELTDILKKYPLKGNPKAYL